ncbi:DUF7511 domain-containing protein [Haloplanus sp.]|uniref:DUF7511 domain-containing protein n=1 Tax=Haloplanus sp. TaxID=1961696 RepID=UPI00262954C1|nr:hypothetical protein [Haloplanus sp.]
MDSSGAVPTFDSFTAAVVEYADAPDECTIYPTDVAEGLRTTTWITAAAGSFCSVENRR